MGDLTLRGIIDRLELNDGDGRLVVTDYKTGKARQGLRYEQSRPGRPCTSTRSCASPCSASARPRCG